MTMPILIQSVDGALNFGIFLDAFSAGVPIFGVPPDGIDTGNITPRQAWQVVEDPLGSGHYLIVHAASGLCVGAGRDVQPGANATDDETDRGVFVFLQTRESINNHYQLWDFLPYQGNDNSFVFIQSSQTGYVIELPLSSTGLTALDLNPRRISDGNKQLWRAVDQNGVAVALPTLTMALLERPLLGHSNYVFIPPNEGDHLTGITITIDIIEDLIVDAFSLQINCNTPYLGPDGIDTEDYNRDAQWMQFGLLMSNNELSLFNQVWHRSGAVPASEFPSITETSDTMLQLDNNAIPAGTRIILNICTDQDDFAIGVAGIVLDSTGLPIGVPTYFSALGRDSWHATVDGGKVHQKAMAPIGDFKVAFCGNPYVSTYAAFLVGMGTITITARPGLVAQSYVANPWGDSTREDSNMHYASVPFGPNRLVAQPFGFTPPPLSQPEPQLGHQLFGGSLEPTVIITEPNGTVVVAQGDGPGPAKVANDQFGEENSKRQR